METRKIAIVGDGAVGSSIAYTLMLGHAVNEIVIIDVNQAKAEGDALDMADGMSFFRCRRSCRAAGYEGCEGARSSSLRPGRPKSPARPGLIF
jgi:L-lactate dehydrogenase